MKLACQEGLVPGQSLEEKLANLEQFGYEGIEFWGRQFLDDPQRVAAVNRACANSRVKPSTICAGFRGCPLDAQKSEREVAVNDLKTLLSAAADLGCVGVIFVPIFGGPRLPDLSPFKTAVELEKELLVKICDDLGRHAEKVGAILLIEPLNRYETHLLKTLRDAVEICERVGNPHVALMADFFHMSIEEAHIPESLKAAAKWVKHIHLADSNRQTPGNGHTDFRAGLAALKEIGYDGYGALECSLPQPAEIELPKTAKYLKECMA
ncbi:MAG: sugar phosphate isomerase/epimerase [Abditibacteriales bacterium]|nr:sugar phosphate isomerase/epimerase [Abditibacteriales bacterium]